VRVLWRVPDRRVWGARSRCSRRGIDELDAESLMPTVVGITAHVAPFNAAGHCARRSRCLSAAELLLTSTRRMEDAVQA